MKKQLGLVLIFAMVCAMLLTACGKEVVATTDPVPTEPAVTTTTSADEAVTPEVSKPEVKTEVEDVKPTEEVKEEFDKDVKYSVAEYVRDGIFYYNDYAISIGDTSDTTIKGNSENTHARPEIRFYANGWMIIVTTSDYSNNYSYFSVQGIGSTSALAIPFKYGDNSIRLYDKADALVPSEVIAMIPALVDYCKSNEYAGQTPEVFDGWTSVSELLAKDSDVADLAKANSGNVEAKPTVPPKEDGNPVEQTSVKTGIPEIDRFISDDGVFDVTGFTGTLPGATYRTNKSGYFIEFVLKDDNKKTIQITTNLADNENDGISYLGIGQWRDDEKGVSKNKMYYDYPGKFSSGILFIPEIPNGYIAVDTLREFHTAWDYIHKYDVEDWDNNPLPEPFEPW